MGRRLRMKREQLMKSELTGQSGGDHGRRCQMSPRMSWSTVHCLMSSCLPGPLAEGGCI